MATSGVRWVGFLSPEGASSVKWGAFSPMRAGGVKWGGFFSIDPRDEFRTLEVKPIQDERRRGVLLRSVAVADDAADIGKVVEL